MKVCTQIVKKHLFFIQAMNKLTKHPTPRQCRRDVICLGWPNILNPFSWFTLAIFGHFHGPLDWPIGCSFRRPYEIRSLYDMGIGL